MRHTPLTAAPGDLALYVGGPVVLASITAHTVEHDEPPGALSAQRFDEGAIPPAHRVPRLSAATWKYASGGVGSLMHVVALHGMKAPLRPVAVS